MPLKAGVSRATFESNVRDMINAGHPQKQALAAAYRKRDESGVANRASGGAVPWFVKREAAAMHTGPIMSAVPGRTDHIPLTVPSGSYVIPSSHVSYLGQDNSMAGIKTLNHMFNSGPYGMKTMAIRHGGLPRPPSAPKFSAGGLSDYGGARESDDGKPVDIMAAGGEYVLSPEQVRAVGNGDLKRGHEILDHWIVETRKKHVKSLRKLPPPAKR